MHQLMYEQLKQPDKSKINVKKKEIQKEKKCATLLSRRWRYEPGWRAGLPVQPTKKNTNQEELFWCAGEPLQAPI